MDQPRHLSVGDLECPPLIPGSLRCYSVKFCPFAERALLTLVYKNVEFDIVNINMKRKPSWFYSRSSLGKVPALERAKGEGTITESLVTMEYLDEAYPEPPLFPRDPWSKAQDKVLVEIFNAKVVPNFYKVFFSKPDDQIKVINAVVQQMNFFEEELRQRRTEFFSGSHPGYIDLAIWPFFERLPAYSDTRMLTEQHPKLIKWVASMKSVPAVRAVMISPQAHRAFLKTSLDPMPDFDLGSSK